MLTVVGPHRDFFLFIYFSPLFLDFRHSTRLSVHKYTIFFINYIKKIFIFCVCGFWLLNVIMNSESTWCIFGCCVYMLRKIFAVWCVFKCMKHKRTGELSHTYMGSAFFQCIAESAIGKTCATMSSAPYTCIHVH